MPVWYGDKVPPPDNGPGDLTRPDPVRLMLETGYYTWHGSRDEASLHLGFLNREVAESWLRDILNAWADPDREDGDGNLLDSLRACLARGAMQDFAGRLESFGFDLAHENLRREESFNAVLQALFRLLADATQSEKSSGEGRSDHEVLVGARSYVFKVKYNRTPDAALRQIRDRQYGRALLADGRTATAVGLAFRKDLKDGPCLQYCTANLAELLAAPREADTDVGPA